MALWRLHVDTAMEPRSSELDRVAAENALLLMLQEGQVSIRDITLYMSSYLTSTDFVVRSKGMIFLGEMVALLQSTFLKEHVIRALALFFTERLEDSACLSGALLGCNSLLKRSKAMGEVPSQTCVEMIKGIKGLELQYLAQRDRLACFELLESAMERHPSEVGTLGLDLVIAVSQKIEGEKDPRCLLLAFRLVERLGTLFPGPEGPLAQGALELFDSIACYFPVSFKLRPTDSKEIKQEDLISGLERAFAASPFFASECIPLLFEKLSSSVKEAKLQSLRFLGTCALGYGSTIMDEYARPLWVALKTELFSHLSSFYTDSEKLRDTDVFEAAVVCLTRCVKAFDNLSDKNGGQLLRLILSDEVCNDLLKHLNDARIYDVREKHHIQTIGRVLSAAARASLVSSYVILKILLPPFLSNCKCPDVHVFNVIVSVLAATRDVAVEKALKSNVLSDTEWFHQFFSSTEKLFSIFTETLPADEADELRATCVAGLQCLVTFPYYLTMLSEADAHALILKLLQIVVDKEKYASSWNQAVQVVASICETGDKCSAFRNSKLVLDRVIQCLIDGVMREDAGSSLMFAITLISQSSRSARDMFFKGLEKHILPSNITGGTKHHQNVITLFSNEFLALYDDDPEAGYSLALELGVRIWSSLELLLATEAPKELLISWMNLVRIIVSMCDFSGQETVILKSFSVLSNRSTSTTATGVLEVTEEWLIGMWSSTVVASRPGVLLVQDEKSVRFLLKAYLEAKSSTISEYIAEALASIFNKWSKDLPATVLDDVLEELLSMRDNSCRVVNILAWIAKALAMRGDSKVARVTGVLMEILINGKADREIEKAAARGLGIVVGGAKALNRRYFANIQPLYRETFFNSFMPALLQALKDLPNSVSRVWLVRGFSNLVMNIPVPALLSQGLKVLPLLLEGLTNSEESDIVLGNLLVLSSFLMDKNNQETVVDHIGAIVNCLVELVHYQQSTAVRETALQCLGAVVGLPYASIYPSSQKVLNALRRALDDPKRSVRNEAARCYQAWWMK